LIGAESHTHSSSRESIISKDRQSTQKSRQKITKFSNSDMVTPGRSTYANIEATIVAQANQMNNKKVTAVNEKSAYIARIISTSYLLSEQFKRYEEEKEKYKTLYEKGVEFGASEFYDVNQTHKNEELIYFTKRIILISNTKDMPYLPMHLCMNDFQLQTVEVSYQQYL
jgi:hypothetical protein